MTTTRHTPSSLIHHSGRGALTLGILLAAASCVDDPREDDDDDSADIETSEAAAAATVSTTPFANGFEAGLAPWKCSGNCPSVVSSPVFAGTKAGNFLLTRTMPTTYRTEAVNGYRFEFDREYTMQLTYRYEDWAPDTDTEAAPFQIHNTPWDWSKNCGSSSAYSTAPFLMASSNNKVRFVTFGGRTLGAEAPIQLKKWTTIKVNFKISKSKAGFIEAWRDGVKIGRVDGQNVPALDKCGTPMREPYFKMGIYKWNWRDDGRPNRSQTTRRQVLIDSVSMAPN
ncbi:MAG: heparin lyase I family protein [Kofleriaceae bacterium]